MKRLTALLAVICMAVVLALNSGCNVFAPNQTPQQQLATLNYDMAVVRAVIQAQPAGARRDALLKKLDAVASYADLAQVVAALSQAGAPPTTIPTDTTARINATK